MGADRKLIMEVAFHNYDEDEEMDLLISTVGESIEIAMGGVAISIALGQAERLLSALNGLSPAVHGSSPQYSGAVTVHADTDDHKNGNFHLGACRDRFFMSIWSIENDREAEMDAGAFDRFIEAVRRAAESVRHG